MAIEQDVASEAALAALSVSDADVAKGKEVRTLDTGDIWRPIRSGVGAALWMKLTALYASATGAIPIAFGTYTPTPTLVTNLDSVTPGVWRYIRVGNQVYCSGPLVFDPTAAGNVTLRLSLPIASDFTVASDLSGMSHAAGGAEGVATANTSTNNAEFLIANAGTTAVTEAGHFMYEVK